MMKHFQRTATARNDYRTESRIGNNSPNPWIRKSSSIPGWLHEGEHEFLWELAMRPQQGYIVEIGSWMGKSTCILAGACCERGDESKVVCIDTFCMDGNTKQVAYYQILQVKKLGTFYEFQSNAAQFGFDRFILPLATKSDNTKLFLKKIPIRMAFIDGKHDAEGIQEDFLTVLPGMVTGGVIAFHDVCDRYSDIRQAIEQIISISPEISHLDKVHCLDAYLVGGNQ